MPRLIYPYIFWSLIYTIGKFLLGITQSLEFSPIYAWQGQYYFMILLQLTLLYPWIRLIKINLAVLISSGILTFIFIYIPFSYLKISNFIAARGEAPFFYWLFYVLFAIYIARHYDETRVYIKAKFPHFQVPFLFILPLLSCLETVLLNHNILNFYLSPGEYSRFSVILISPVLFLLFLSLNFTSKNILQNTIVDLMSKWSLGIFCLNPIVISSIYILGKNIQFNTYFSDIPDLLQLIIRLLLAIVTCIVSILLCYLISLVGGKGLVK